MRIILIIIFFITTSCSSNKLTKNHGHFSLNNKINSLKINKMNKNDIRNLLGPPSTISEFNENQWTYIETSKVNRSFIKLGAKKTKTNNVMILNFNSKGILSEKKIYNLNDMNDYKFSEMKTKKKFYKKNVLYDVLSSLREKANAPARNRNKSN